MDPSERRRNPTGRQQSTKAWTWYVIGGVGAVVVVVGILLYVLGVFDSEPEPVDAPVVFTDQQMQEFEAEGHALGSANAPVTLLEFGDFQCPHCRAFWIGSLQPIENEFVETGEVRVVFHHFPFIGEESIRAAEAADCAADQDQFFPYFDLLYENQGPENAGLLTNERLEGFASDLGLDLSAFSPCLEGEVHRQTIIEGAQHAADVGIRGTPTVIVNGKLVSGVMVNGDETLSVPRDAARLLALIRQELGD